MSSAETLAAGEAIDEGEVLVDALTNLLNIKIGLCIAVHSKDLFSTLSTCSLFEVMLAQFNLNLPRKLFPR